MRSVGLRSESKQGGFSLIETIITLVVLSIAAVGILAVFTTGIQKSADPILVNQAIALAQEKMDETIALKKTGGFGAVIPVASGPFVPAVTGFTWSRTVNCVTPADLNATTGGTPPCASGYAHVIITVNNVVVGNVSVDMLVTNY